MTLSPGPLPLVAVLGPTASGKSGLAEWLAAQRGGELVNADASALYRELEIGVTKPDAATRSRLPYHLLDVADLSQTITLVDYQQMALRVLEEISSREALPILVGGSSLYVRALLEGYRPPEISVSEEIRSRVRDLSAEAAREELSAIDPEAYARIDTLNPRRVSRALELAWSYGGPVPPATRRPLEGYEVLRLILWPEPEVLRERVRLRTEAMWEGWREEVLALEKKALATWLEVRKPIGYATVARQIRGELRREEAIDEIVTATVRLAKKQKTWLQKETDGCDRHLWVLDTESSWDGLPDRALAVLDGFLARFFERRGETQTWH